MRWPGRKRRATVAAHPARPVFARMTFVVYGRKPGLEYADGDWVLWIDLGRDSWRASRLRPVDVRALVEAGAEDTA